MDNDRIASLLLETSLYMELAGENPFKIRSFRRAAETVARAGEDCGLLAREDRLTDLPGVGKGIAREIEGLLARGSLAVLEDLKRRIPGGLAAMTRIRGLGAARVRRIHEALGVSTLGELEYACRENRLARLKGFGSKLQAAVLDEIGRLRESAGFFHCHYALRALEEAESFLAGCSGVRRTALSGEVRRGMEIVSAGVLLAEADDPPAAAEAFRGAFPGIAEGGLREEQGPGGMRLSLEGGLPLDLFFASAVDFPFVLLATTGSEIHVEELSERALDRGLRFEEGILIGPEGERVEVSSEEAVYAALGLDFIPPEMREGRGEIAAAAAGATPDLVARSDLEGVLHVHTDWSDGRETIEAMARAARERGYSYLGVSDHSRSAKYAGGLSVERLLEQGRRIRRLKESLDGIEVLCGVEADILPDGSLDYPPDVLDSLDFVVASVHGSFNLGRDEMTARIIKAMENPATAILGHPTGRLLLGRRGYDLDMEAVLEAAARLGVMVEINANPQRLDLDWRHLARCRELGVRIVVNPDAHDIPGLDDVDFGVRIARKGWLGAEHVANTLPAREIKGLWRARRGGG